MDSTTKGETMSADMRRRALDAATRFRRAVTLLRYNAVNARNESERWLAGYEAETLLSKMLWEARDLVDVLNDDASDEAERYARAVCEALRARRLVLKLENVSGRTLEEAELFKRKAKELRDG